MEIVLIVGLFCALIFFMHQKPSPPTPPQLPPYQPSLPNEIQNEIEELRNKISELTNELSEKDSEIQRFRDAFNDRDNKVLELNRILDDRKIEILRLNDVLQERDKEIKRLNKTLREKEKIIEELQELLGKTPSPPTKNFVSVMFDATNPESTFDYLMGDIVDLKIGDIVLVPVRKSKIEKKKTGPKLVRAIVKYISKPGEVSSHARSPIIKKL